MTALSVAVPAVGPIANGQSQPVRMVSMTLRNGNPSVEDYLASLAICICFGLIST